MTVPVIAIDGPSASGKGTIASRVADSLDFHYLESGALYRLVALESLRTGVRDEASLTQVAKHLPVSFHNERIILADQDVTDAIRSEDVGVRASEVAPLPAVRRALLERQRLFRQPPGLVADGRDMGTTVFPDAFLKVFLTASPGKRAERRHKQLIDKGESVSLRALVKDIRARDERDRTRAVSPLVAAEDSVRVDSTGMSIEAVLEEVLQRWNSLKDRNHQVAPATK